MENFNAKDAKRISDSFINDDLNGILFQIKQRALEGETTLYVYSHLDYRSIEILKDKGFNVIQHSGIETHKDNLYYTIKW